MKIGDYVRTRNGLIFKIVGGNADNWELDISCGCLETFEENWLELYRYNDNGSFFDDKNIIKSSPNIIDLIEVRDYVNGRKVIALRKDVSERDIHMNSKDDLIFTDYDIANNWYYGIDTDKIKSIVTKEQFESLEYKLKTKENTTNE